MSFLAPGLLAALVLLPALWWLLRATPPAPRLQDFPAIRLLVGLRHDEETPSRTPPWLLALRLAAAAALIVGLAGPVVGHASHAGGGDTLLVIDDGWAAAHDWQRRIAAADAIVGEAARAGGHVAILATADDDDGAPPAATAFLPGAVQRARIAALRPHPWPVDREAAAAALAAVEPRAGAAGRLRIDYVGDGLAAETGQAGAADAAFRRALARLGTVTELRDTSPAELMLAPLVDAQGLTVRLAALGGVPPGAKALALDASGGALADVPLSPDADADPAATGGATVLSGRVTLPLELRNALSRIVLAGSASAATTRLLDESDRRRPVGILGGGPGSDTPLLGTLFYVERALASAAEIRRGSLDQLLARPLSVLILADRTIADPGERARIEAWVEKGGMLIRFAGPALAGSGDAGATPGSDASAADAPDADGAVSPDADPLLPVALLPGTRALGGAMSWTRPQHLAAFPAGSPFAGIPVPAEVTVSRQVLARPSLDLAAHSWAMLADGTPLVTARTLGRGRVVLFGVTANADWSNLPLSGLFPQMLLRLVHLASGIANPGDRTLLAPVASLDAAGTLGLPGPVASGIPADRFGATPASPRHPPGLYGRSDERRALNVADALPPLAPFAPAARVVTLDRRPEVQAFGPALVALATALLALDLALSLGLRGLLRRPARLVAGLLALAALAGTAPREARAVTPPPAEAPAPAPLVSPRAALETELAYVVTGNEAVDRLSREGLGALSDYVNARTAAVLGEPAGVRPGKDDLAFYPLIYWPILAGEAADPAAVTALSNYMRLGGIVVLDTQGSGPGDPDADSGAGFAPGAAAALRRLAGGLDVPPLTPLTPSHVLGHSFYLLHDFPGRFVGAPVWVARGGDPSNDGVSPVIIGANDWAGAWAVGPDGQSELSVLPGGDRQRTLAYRFGVNLVMYALTGNYKADQLHVPALLQRLGQDAANRDAVGGGDGGGVPGPDPDQGGPDQGSPDQGGNPNP